MLIFSYSFNWENVKLHSSLHHSSLCGSLQFLILPCSHIVFYRLMYKTCTCVNRNNSSSIFFQNHSTPVEHKSQWIKLHIYKWKCCLQVCDTILGHQGALVLHRPPHLCHLVAEWQVWGGHSARPDEALSSTLKASLPDGSVTPPFWLDHGRLEEPRTTSLWLKVFIRPGRTHEEHIHVWWWWTQTQLPLLCIDQNTVNVRKRLPF